MVAPGTNKINDGDSSTNKEEQQKKARMAKSLGPASRPEHKVSLNADPRDEKRGRSVAIDLKYKKFDLGAYYTTNALG